MSSSNNSKNKKKRNKIFYNFCYDFVKVTGALPMLLWFRPKVYRPTGAKTPKGAVLVSANHIDLLDPVKILLTFPGRRLHSLATKDLYKNKLLTFFFNQMHCIQVDKANFSVSAFHEVVSRLKDDRMVLIFPEGQVNTEKQDTLLAFKSGVVLMAHKGNAPILPVYIAKRESRWHRLRVFIGEPIFVGDISGKMPTMQDLTAICDTLRERELELRKYSESLPFYKKQKNESENN